MGEDKQYSRYLYQPARAGRASIEEYQRRANNPTKSYWVVPEMDEYLIPPNPGDLCCYIGRPGHAKTSTLIYLCKQSAKQLTHGEISIYATWETMIEEFVALYNGERSGQSLESIGRGTANLSKLVDAIAQGVGDNVAVVGRSMERDEHGNIGTPEVHTLDDLDACLSDLTRHGMRIGSLFVDYLQRIPGRRGTDRSMQASENLERLKDMSLKYACHTHVGVQAGRSVDEGNGLQIPGLSDGQWTSAIEQTTDKLYGITRPILYLDEGYEIVLAKSGRMYRVDSKLMVYRVIKQRWGRAGKTFYTNLYPEMCLLEEAHPEEARNREQILF